jgi:hypothetical protein
MVVEEDVILKNPERQGESLSVPPSTEVKYSTVFKE